MEDVGWCFVIILRIYDMCVDNDALVVHTHTGVYVCICGVGYMCVYVCMHDDCRVCVFPHLVAM